jgi:hypothetical protein
VEVHRSSGYDEVVSDGEVDAETGKRIAELLKEKGVRGILVVAAEHGYIADLKCEMEHCWCPEELGGRSHFDPIHELPDWIPTYEHSPRRRDGGQRSLEHAVLAHRLCNRVAAAIADGRSYEGDLERVEAARRRARESQVWPTESS